MLSQIKKAPGIILREKKIDKVNNNEIILWLKDRGFSINECKLLIESQTVKHETDFAIEYNTLQKLNGGAKWELTTQAIDKKSMQAFSPSVLYGYKIN
jgi:DNA-binding transcriptional MerR regulator